MKTFTHFFVRFYFHHKLSAIENDVHKNDIVKIRHKQLEQPTLQR